MFMPTNPYNGSKVLNLLYSQSIGKDQREASSVRADVDLQKRGSCCVTFGAISFLARLLVFCIRHPQTLRADIYVKYVVPR